MSRVLIGIDNQLYTLEMLIQEHNQLMQIMERSCHRQKMMQFAEKGTVMKASEAFEQGYVVKEVKFQRGYTSRKTELNDRDVLTAQGRRKGQKYFLYPCSCSTRYCYRMYIEKP